MKKLLFVLPNLKTGGTMSSFISLYNQIGKSYDIDVFLMGAYDATHLPFHYKTVGFNWLLSAYNSNIGDLRGIERLIAYPLKMLRRVCGSMSSILERKINRYCARQLEKNGYDTVVAFQEGSPTYFAAQFEHTRKIAWIHCNYRYRYDSCHLNEEDLYSRYDKIVNVSRFTQKEFLQFYPLLAPNCVAINNFIDYDGIVEKSTEFFSSEFDGKKFNIISVGRMVPIKRFELVPAIAKKLVDRDLAFEWYIIGPYDNDSQISGIVTRIEKYGLQCVQVLGGRSNPYPYFKHANLLVCTSESEACPMIFNEAKVLGLPIVTTDFGSAEEFVTNGYDGFICSIDKIADTITDYYYNDDLQRKIKSNIIGLGNPNEAAIALIKELFD